MKRLEDFNIRSKKPWEVEGVEWREVRLKDLISKEKYEVGKVQVRNGLAESGEIPVIDQSQELIRGYLNNEELKYRGPLPLIIFGDHTKIIKFIDFPFIVGADGVKILIPNKDILYSKYFYWVLRKVKLPDRGYARHFKFLKQATYLLPFRNDKPDLETQKKIVEYIEANFSRIDEILEKKKKELEQLDELLESVLEHAFKPKEGEEWREVRLKEVVKEVKSGFALSKRKRMKLSSEDGIPQLRPYNIANWNKIDLSQMTYVPMNMEGIEDYFIRVDDVLFNNTNSIELVGRAAVFKESSGKYTYSNHITRLRVRDLYFPEYISWAINSLWLKGVFYLKATKWIGQAGISNKKLLSIKIPLPFRNNQPNIEKQKEIASYLDSVYEKIKALKEMVYNQITQLEEMKESILDGVFNHDKNR